MIDKPDQSDLKYHVIDPVSLKQTFEYWDYIDDLEEYYIEYIDNYDCFGEINNLKKQLTDYRFHNQMLKEKITKLNKIIKEHKLDTA